MLTEPQLTALAKSMLHEYFDTPVSLSKTTLGNANANYIVSNQNKKYFFRIYLPVKDFGRKLEELEKEIDVVS